MSQRLRAVYHSGCFVPKEPCDVPEGSEVELIIQGPAVLLPEVTDPEERRRILKAVLESTLSNPLPASAPRLTREELHERR